MLATRKNSGIGEGAIAMVADAGEARDREAFFLHESGLSVEIFSESAAAIHYMTEHLCPVVVVALQDPTAERDTIEGIKRISPDTEIIALSSNETTEDSNVFSDALVDLIFDCLPLSTDADLLIRTIHHAMQRHQALLHNRAAMAQLEMEQSRLQRQVSAAKRVLERRLSSSPAFIGESDTIVKIRQFVAEIAPSDQTVLIRGESGTGKDMVARLIHEWSGRNINVFLKISCPPLSEVLLLSELFGHESVMLTGGEKRRPGRFEQAADGTVFLDEIGKMPIAVQKKMLQAVQDREFVRIGGSEKINMNCRLLVSTRVSLEDQVYAGRFDSNLYNQLRECAVLLPGLCKRMEDIPLLVRHFLNKYGAKFARPGMDVSPRMMSAMMQYDWPGNVRELESAIMRYVSSGMEDALLSVVGMSDNGSSKPVAISVSSNEKGSLRDTEIQTIANALAKSRWNQRRAAQLLGVSYSALRRRIAKYDLKNRPIASP